MSSSSTHDKAEGNLKQAGGKVRRVGHGVERKVRCLSDVMHRKIKETVGHAIGNEHMEAEGKAKNLEGKVEHKIGEIKKVFGE
jgi:uncharacterized protein YjbJ (UPF0337 family)